MDVLPRRFVLLCCQECSFAKKLRTCRYHASIELVLTTMNDFSSRLIDTPVNMPDPIWKCFGYGQLWPLQPACSQNWARSYMPDPTSCILFSSVFSKQGMGHAMPNQPGSDLDGLARVQQHSSGLKASWCAGIIGPGFWQDATGPLPVSHFSTRLHSSTDVPHNIIQNQPGADLVLADCARFGPNGSGPEASRCARNIRPASGQRFPADPARMRIESCMFTGTKHFV